MAAIDHNNTLVLLIGASEFPEDSSITPIPNIQANIKQMRKCLLDPDVIGIPDDNITVSLNESKSQIERKLTDITERTSNNKYTLLIYYSGHGILSSKNYNLYLTTYQTSKKYLESDGIRVEDFKQHIKVSLSRKKDSDSRLLS